MTTTLAPTPVFKAFNNNGQPLAGGQLFTYAAGTTTPQATWTDSSQTTPNPNPVILDARGEASVWLDVSLTYKLVLQDSFGNLVGRTVDNVGGGEFVNGVPFSLIPTAAGTFDLGSVAFPWNNGYFNNVYAATAAYINNIPIPTFPQTAAELAVSVTPTNYLYPPGAPERYIAAGFTYATASTGAGGTDFAPAINTALSVAGQPCMLGPHLYTINSGISFATNAQKLIGQGINETYICLNAAALPAPPGPIITDSGNASKLELRGFTLFCNNAPNASRGIYMGYGASQFGTEGFIDQVMVRDLLVQCLAFDINANVGEFGAIYAYQTGGIRIKGTANSVVQMENTAAKGFNDVNGNVTATEFYDGWIGFFECEAPVTSIILLTLSGATRVDNFVPSLAPSTTYAELVYITNRVTSGWRVNIPIVYYKGTSGTFGTFTNLFFDQAANVLYGAGNPSNTTTPLSMCGEYGGNAFYSGTLAVNKQQLNAFTIRVTNPAGTIQHRIGAVGASSVPTNFATSINAASATLQNTPTGTDSSTAFAFGGKIGSASPSFFIFDSGAEITANSLMIATISANSTTVAYTITAFMSSINVNGVTQNRLCLQLTNPTTAAAVSWATALTAGGGVLIDVSVFGFFN